MKNATKIFSANAIYLVNAGIAQLVEQLICNQQVVGSNPTAGSFNLRLRLTHAVQLRSARAKRRLKFCFDTFWCSEASAPVDQAADQNESERTANDF